MGIDRKSSANYAQNMEDNEFGKAMAKMEDLLFNLTCKHRHIDFSKVTFSIIQRERGLLGFCY
jgi:hypothetical protein